MTSIHYWSSDWGPEWSPHIVSATSSVEIAVTAGRSSKGHHPFVIIEDGNQAHFLAVAWSGNWRILCQPLSTKIFICVESDCRTTNIITKSVLAGGIDRAMRKFIAEFRSLVSHTTPKLITEWNSWWPYEDIHINEGVLLANAERAQSAGIEVVVLDAGWFGLPSRHSYWYQLRGGWDHRNAERFPSGLKRIGEAIRNLGIEFGIWLEVEALGESSQLAQTRPDFAAQRSGQNLGYVCLANPDAREWAHSIARNLINECGATWLKMDFNVDPGAGCNRSDHGHEPVFGLSDHLHNLYQLFDFLKVDFPDLTIESCSSGGLRWDLAIAAHVDFGFSSDPDWPEHALSCFWASSLFFPAEKLLGWCDSQWCGEHAHQDFTALGSSDLDLEFALSITLLGGFGISARLDEFSDDKLRIVAHYVNIYMSHFRPRYQCNAFIKHLSPQPQRESKGCRTVMFAIENQVHAPLLTIYQLEGRLRLPFIEYLPPKRGAIYRISNLISGEVLHQAHQGTLSFQNRLSDNSSVILGFEEIFE